MLWQKIIGSNRGAKSFDYVTSIQYDGVSTTNLTLSNISLGVANPNRRIILAFCWSDGGTGTITSVTIGGVSATRAANSNSAAIFRNDEIWIAQVPSGSTGSIVIARSFSTTGASVHGAIFRAVGTAISLHNTAASYNDLTAVASSRSVNLSVPANGFSVAAYGHGAAATGTTTSWTNMTKRTDYLSSGTTHKSMAGNTENSATTKTVTAVSTDASVNRPGLVAASWSF